MLLNKETKPNQTNYSIQNNSFDGSKYCCVLLTIQLNFSYLFTELYSQAVLFLTTQFSISHLFALSLNVKQFYLTNR